MENANAQPNHHVVVSVTHFISSARFSSKWHEKHHRERIYRNFPYSFCLVVMAFVFRVLFVLCVVFTRNLLTFCVCATLSSLPTNVDGIQQTAPTTTTTTKITSSGNDNKRAARTTNTLTHLHIHSFSIICIGDKHYQYYFSG